MDRKLPARLTREQAKKLLYGLKKYHYTRIFGVTFIKKDGSERKMGCRFGVTKDLIGVGMKYDPADYDLVCVHDVQKDGKRMVNLATLTEIRLDGVVVTVA